MDEILKDVYTWSVYSGEKKLHFNGYFITAQNPLFGNIVIDPPQASDSDLEQMESLGSVQHIIITNQDHIRNSKEFQQKFGAEIQINTNDERSSVLISDHNFNHGDALIGKPKGAVTLLPKEKYDDIQKTKIGISILQNLDFKHLLLGDGDSILHNGKEIVSHYFH